jgi:homoserine kinase
MANTRAEAFAPATMANLGVGFDILGLAITGAGDTVIAERRDRAGAIMAAIEGDGGRLPYAADKNVATIAANALLQVIAPDVGIALTLQKGLPLASGLGSSAASSVAAVMAVNALLGEPLPRTALLPYALEGEAAVSGYHADNAAPSLLGGITLTTGIQAHQIHRLPVPDSLWLALVTPDVEVPTAEARATLPTQIPLKTLVHQTGAVAELIDALYRGDIRAMAQAMARDIVVEPARAHLIPHIDAVRFAVTRAGAYNLVISGAGPTLCAVCDSEASAREATQAMAIVYADAGIAHAIRVTQVLQAGAQVIRVQS